MKTKHLVIIVLLIVLALTSCGGHKSGSTAQTGSPAKGQQVSPNGTIDQMPAPPTDKYTSTVSVIPNLIQVTSTESTDSLDARVAKYGYSVAYRTGNYVTLNVPNGDLDSAARQLHNEPTVLAVDVIHQYAIHTPLPKMPVVSLTRPKTPSYLPAAPFYADLTLQPDFSDAINKWPYYEQDLYYFRGQKQLMGVMNPEQGWEVLEAFSGVSATPVVVAIIDAGVYKQGATEPNPGNPHYQYPFDANHWSPKSAHVFAAGNVDTTDWGYDTFVNSQTQTVPYRNVGNALLGLVAAPINSAVIYTRPPATPPRPSPLDTWAAGIAGVDPYIQVMVIKTGTGSGSGDIRTWSFTDQEITSSINYAVANGANIILLGMFSNVGATPVNTALQTAITAARNAGILVVAPAGEGDMSQAGLTDPDGSLQQTPPVFTGDELWNNGVDVSNISPAKATGVMAVAGSGINQSNFPSTRVANQYPAPYIETTGVLQGFSNKGQGIAIVAPGWGFTFSGNYYNPFPGTEYSAGYVAGAAAICYQALTNHNGGTPPASVDQTIETILQQTAIKGVAGVPNTTGILDIGLAATIANNGGWDMIKTGLAITAVQTPNVYNMRILATVGDPRQLSVNVIGGTSPLGIFVDWGDGTRTPGSGTITPFLSGDAISKPSPYMQPGNYNLVIVVNDSSVPQQVSAISIPVLASNPLGIGTITLTDGNGNPITNPYVNTDYTFFANLTNVLVAPGNTVSYLWDFGDSTTSTLENPVHKWLGVGSKIVTLTVTETLRIPVTHQDTFTVT